MINNTKMDYVEPDLEKMHQVVRHSMAQAKSFTLSWQRRVWISQRQVLENYYLLMESLSLK